MQNQFTKLHGQYLAFIVAYGKLNPRPSAESDFQRYEVIESYPDDKYLPSYLVSGTAAGVAFHVLFAVDVEADHARMVTAYRPNPTDWEPDLRTRSSKT